ncbi:tape measure protein [Pararhizobium gei]|uniref:tape measure protein n=1 Tax=Pararhizobium gei TaxID=1395951 RepID=UPI0023DAFA5B|nr:tape measure protein [Rhizobium gei]
MATDLEKLLVQLSMDIKQYQRESLKAQGVTNGTARAIEARYRQMDSRLGSIGKSAARSLVVPLTGVAAALSVQDVAKYADAWTGAKNSLAVAGVVGANQADVLDRIYKSAQRNAAPIGALAGLFGKAAQANDNLNASQERLLQFTDGVGTALRIEGKSAAEASGALTQLGQLLGSTRVQAEEFNSVNEGARPILIAVAAGLDAAGGSVNKLKKLVNDGEVSGKQFFDAFLKGLPKIEAMAANSTQTIEQGVTKVTNAFTKYIGETDSSLGASQRLTQGLNALADNFDETADVALQLASVLAGALVGRALSGVIVKGALATKVLKQFFIALRGTATVGQVATAIGGLSAAAGPLGVILGAVATGTFVHFSANAAEASERSKRLAEEMRSLGLLGPEAATGVDSVAKAVDSLADEKRVKKLRDINAELDRMRGGGDPFGGGNEVAVPLGAIQSRAYITQSQYATPADADALNQIAEIAGEAQEVDFSVSAALEKLKKIALLDVSKGVIDLNNQLENSIRHFRKTELFGAVNGNTKPIDDAVAAVRELDSELDNLQSGGAISADLRKQVDVIVGKLEQGAATADQTSEALERVASVEPNVQGYVSRLQPLLFAFEKIRKAAKDTAEEVARVTGKGTYAEGYRSQGYTFKSESEKSLKATGAFLDQRTIDAQRSELEKQVNDRTDAILEAAKKISVALDKSAAEIQARKEIAAEAAVRSSERSVSSAAELIKGYEGFRTKPYWDVNAMRAGFGSDTVTLDDGSVRKVTDGITVSLESANRDLDRRIGEFQKGIEGKIGRDTFRSMDDGQQAALTSIAYNYGSLPDRIVAAIKSGDAGTVYNAIKGLGEDNGGINRGRRNSEADLYLKGAPAGVQDRVQVVNDFQQTLKEQHAYIDGLKAEAGIRTTLNPLVNDYGLKLSTLQAAQQLLTEAQRQGTEAGRELKDVQQLLNGDLSGLSPVARDQAMAMRTLAEETGKAEAAGEQLTESQDQLRERLSESAALGKDVLGGFISDLRKGKSATEALGSALEKLGEKMLDNALNMLFDGSVAGSGGGLLGGLFSMFTGGPLRLAGGGHATRGRVRGPGGPKGDKIPAFLSDGEHVTRAAMAKKYGPLLDAINADRVSLLANGTPMRAPTMPNLSRGARSRDGMTYAPVHHIDARGADQAAIARLERAMAENNRTEAKRFASFSRNSRLRGIYP